MEQSQIINCLMERDQYLFNRFKLISIEFVFAAVEPILNITNARQTREKN